MGRNLLVSLADYWESPVKPQNFKEFCNMHSAKDGPLGLWCVQSIDLKSGAVLAEQWVKNKLTDNGALAGWKNLFAASGGAVAPFSTIAITTNAGVTALTAQLTSGQVYTSLPVNALPGPIASGSSVVLGAGTAQTQTVTTNALANAGATSISVSSFTANATYAIGSNVAPLPNDGDNPASLGGTVSYATLSAGAFTYSGSGAGNRQVSFQFTFTSANATAANYTEAWVCNANPVTGVNQTAVHMIFNAPGPVNSTSGQLVSVVEKY